MGYYQGIHEVSSPLPPRHLALYQVMGVLGRSGTVLTGRLSLTPLRANYMQASEVPYGELKL